MFKKLWYFIKTLARADKEFNLLRRAVEDQNKTLKDLISVVNRVQREVSALATKKVQ